VRRGRSTRRGHEHGGCGPRVQLRLGSSALSAANTSSSDRPLLLGISAVAVAESRGSRRGFRRVIADFDFAQDRAVGAQDLDDMRPWPAVRLVPRLP
jgi:hypothetical protein